MKKHKQDLKQYLTVNNAKKYLKSIKVLPLVPLFFYFIQMTVLPKVMYFVDGDFAIGVKIALTLISVLLFVAGSVFGFLAIKKNQQKFIALSGLALCLVAASIDAYFLSNIFNPPTEPYSGNTFLFAMNILGAIGVISGIVFGVMAFFKKQYRLIAIIMVYIFISHYVVFLTDNLRFLIITSM